MTIPRKGSRKIVVDGVKYRWLIRRKATYSQADYGDGKIHVAIESDDKNGTILLIETDRPHPADCATDEVIPVKPSDVASWIKAAIGKGWNPKKSSATFRIQESE